MTRMVRARLAMAIACIFSMLAAGPISGEYTLSATDRSELISVTQQLGEFMRQDVEKITVDDEHVLTVPLTKTTPGGSIYRSVGALVPFFAEGQGGGNFFGEYLALFILIDPDDQRLEDFGHGDNKHKHVGLLAFTQIDNRGPILPQWANAVVSDGAVTVPVEIDNCGGRHGMMMVYLNNDDFGSRMALTFDKDATLGADACIR